MMSKIITGRLQGVGLQIFKTGVLLIGESGIGKTDTALSLIDRGHKLIADDVVEYIYKDSQIILYPVENILQFIHIRGIGFIDINKAFSNYYSVISSGKLDIVIELTNDNNLLNSYHLSPICGEYILNQNHQLILPKFILPIGKSIRNLPLLIEQIVKIFIDKSRGIDNNQIFLERYNKFFEEQT
jgi:HPr kinase/phosphorylase